MVLVWDNAGWHRSQAIRTWLGAHNQQAHRDGGVRLVPCLLPTKSPWLNPIEPKGVPGNRRIIAPARLLPAPQGGNGSGPPSPVRSAITCSSPNKVA